jgi:AcrR family transcriptional regulator
MDKAERILCASNSIFLLYGYHGTTIQRIADTMGINKSLVHYYYRSKNNLYRLVVKEVFDLLKNAKNSSEIDKDKFINIIWFLITELHNNKIFFISLLNELYPNNLPEIINNIKLSIYLNDKELKSQIEKLVEY